MRMDPTRRRLSRQMNCLRSQFAQCDGLAFAEVLPPEHLVQALREEGACWRDILYTPLLTLWAFLSQVISADDSCRATVARVLAWLVAQGEPPCSPNTDPYCKARKRLPENLLRRLLRQTGRTLHEQVPTTWLWKGRRVKVVDGTTVTMADTSANQEAYPQLKSQPPGAGFPIGRLVVVFCLACGTALDSALTASRPARRLCCAPWRTSLKPTTCCWRTAVLAAISISPAASSGGLTSSFAYTSGDAATCVAAVDWVVMSTSLPGRSRLDPSGWTRRNTRSYRPPWSCVKFASG
jgi:hypothetical protein